MRTRLRDLPFITGTCRRCGKAISGFPGDFAKCGPCGTMTQLPLTPPPGWRLVRRAEQLPAIPIYMVAGFYASIIAIVLTQGGTSLVGGAIVVLVFATWIFSIMQFKKAAEHQPRWWLPVVLYHVAGSAIPLCFWLGAGGCDSVMHGDVSLGAISRLLASAVGLLVCILIYGFARGSVARLRVVRSA